MWTEQLRSKLQGFQVVLGSSSPRRKEILRNNVGITDFNVVTSTFEENLSKEGISDKEYVQSTAQHKISSIVDQLPPNINHLLIVADTVVSCSGQIFEKPGSREKQQQMLRHYRRNANDIRVITSVHVSKVCDGQILVHKSTHAVTSLRFNGSLSDDQLQYYVESGEGVQVAGGFKFQEQGCMLFEEIDGDYFNVVGLPVAATFSLLAEVLEAE